MRKNIIIICTILSGLMILDSLNVAQAIMMFFLAGQIPATNIYIDAARMMEFFALATGFVFARLTIRAFTLIRTRRPVQVQA